MFFAFDDKTGRVEVAAFSDTAVEYGPLVNKDQLLIVDGLLSPDEFSGGFQVRATRILTPEQAISEFARGVEFVLTTSVDEKLEQLLRSHQGSVPIVLHYRNQHAAASLRLGQGWTVTASRELVAQLDALPYIENASLSFV